MTSRNRSEGTVMKKRIEIPKRAAAFLAAVLVLSSLALPAFAKTSGSTGIHVLSSLMSHLNESSEFLWCQVGKLRKKQ